MIHENQADLEHVNDLDSIYSACSMWIKSQGWMSHQIDLTSHGTANAWNGHWAYPGWLWRLILGKRPFLINRQPYSMNNNLLKRFGFNIVAELMKTRADGILRGQLVTERKRLSDDDFSCAGAYLVARKHREESYNLA